MTEPNTDTIPPRPDRAAIALYDGYTHGQMDRRTFMDRLAALAGSAAAASALLGLLANDYAKAAIVAPDDRRITAETVTYAGPDGPVSGLLARGKGGGRRPAVLVIHENRGLNPHIQDVTRRLAVSGFLAFGVDLLSVSGGTPADEDAARDLIGKLDPAQALAAAAAAAPFLAAHPESNGAVGAVGFCWGGGMVNRLAAAAPELKAGVAYYGQPLATAQVPAIKTPLLLHYAGLDQRINAGVPDYQKALKDNGKAFELHMYEGVEHAFNNDANPARYDRKAANLAWDRTIAFLETHLGSAVPPT